MEKDKIYMTYEIDNLETDLISEWMKEIKEICQEREREKLLESKKEYDHVIKLT